MLRYLLPTAHSPDPGNSQCLPMLTQRNQSESQPATCVAIVCLSTRALICCFPRCTIIRIWKRKAQDSNPHVQIWDGGAASGNLDTCHTLIPHKFFKIYFWGTNFLEYLPAVILQQPKHKYKTQNNMCQAIGY